MKKISFLGTALTVGLIFFTLLISGCGDDQEKRHAEFLSNYMANVQAAMPQGKLDKNSDAYKKLVKEKNEKSLNEFSGRGGIVSYDIPKKIKSPDSKAGTPGSTTVTVVFNNGTTDDFLISFSEREGKFRVGQVLSMGETRAFLNGEMAKD